MAKITILVAKERASDLWDNEYPAGEIPTWDDYNFIVNTMEGYMSTTHTHIDDRTLQVVHEYATMDNAMQADFLLFGSMGTNFAPAFVTAHREKVLEVRKNRNAGKFTMTHVVSE